MVMTEMVFTIGVLATFASLVFHLGSLVHSLTKKLPTDYRNVSFTESALDWAGVQIKSTYSILFAFVVLTPICFIFAGLAQLEKFGILFLALALSTVLVSVNIILNSGVKLLATRLYNYRVIDSVLSHFNSYKRSILDTSINETNLIGSKTLLGRLLVQLSLRIITVSKGSDLI